MFLFNFLCVSVIEAENTHSAPSTQRWTTKDESFIVGSGCLQYIFTQTIISYIISLYYHMFVYMFIEPIFCINKKFLKSYCW